MTDLLQGIVHWRLLILVLVVFGFAPGAALRIIVLAYPRTSPRRAELIAELYAMPPIARPRWVFEQLELALFTGVPERTSERRWRRLEQAMEGLSDRLVGGAELVEILCRAKDTEAAEPAFHALDDCVRTGYRQIRGITKKARRVDMQPETAAKLMRLQEVLTLFRERMIDDSPKYLKK